MVSFAATQIFFSRLRATICAVLVIPFGRQGVTASTFVFKTCCRGNLRAALEKNREDDCVQGLSAQTDRCSEEISDASRRRCQKDTAMQRILRILLGRQRPLTVRDCACAVAVASRIAVANEPSCGRLQRNPRHDPYPFAVLPSRCLGWVLIRTPPNFATKASASA